jgi:uncharacterized protein
MARVVHFEIHADNTERAAEFYKKVFDWNIKKWDGPTEYWLVYTGETQPGIDGAILKREEPLNGDATVGYICTMDVPSVNEYSGKVTESGGTIVRPKKAIPHVGYLAYCRDTEGNIFGIMESDETAK